MIFTFFSVPCNDDKMCQYRGSCERGGDYSFCKCKEGTSGDFCENFDLCKYFCGKGDDVTCNLDLKGNYCGCKDKAYKFDSLTKSCKRMFHY